VITAYPGYDEIILTMPDSPRLCHSRACSQAGRLAQVIVTYGVLNDPGTSPHSSDALWPESWGPVLPDVRGVLGTDPACRGQDRPRLVIRDTTRSPATPEPSRGRT
jgi:hypothetical protein